MRKRSESQRGERQQQRAPGIRKRARARTRERSPERCSTPLGSSLARAYGARLFFIQVYGSGGSSGCSVYARANTPCTTIRCRKCAAAGVGGCGRKCSGASLFTGLHAAAEDDTGPETTGGALVILVYYFYTLQQRLVRAERRLLVSIPCVCVCVFVCVYTQTNIYV